jgi:membrane protease YdiL (CAAX protease family)
MPQILYDLLDFNYIYDSKKIHPISVPKVIYFCIRLSFYAVVKQLNNKIKGFGSVKFGIDQYVRNILSTWQYIPLELEGISLFYKIEIGIIRQNALSILIKTFKSAFNATFTASTEVNLDLMSILKKVLIFIGVMATCTLLGLLLIKGVEYIYAFPMLQDLSKIKASLIIGHLTSFILCAILLANIYGKTSFLNYAGFDLNINWLLLLKLLLLLVLCYPMAGLSAALMAQLDFSDLMLGLDEKNFEILQQLLAINHWYDFVFNIIIVAVLPGLGEEMLFRGVIQNEMQKHMTNKYLPLIFTAFIFAIFHLEPTGLFAKFFIGCVLGYAYIITKNILYPMIIHAANNATQLFIAHFTNGLEDTSFEIPAPNATQVIGALLTIPLIYFLINHINKEHSWIRS